MQGLYEAVRQHDFAETTCFLCGKPTDASTASQEHIFPKWLLHRFNLWDVPVVLINGTTIPYRKLVVPCCKDCNGRHLSGLETEVQRAVESGPEAFGALNRTRLFIWSMKIFYGLLYRELFLPFDRTDSDLGTIVTPEVMEQYQLLHYMLQSCRVPMRFSCQDSDVPGSLYSFWLKQPKEPSDHFDFRDDIVHSVIYLRMGSVGLLAAFDAGAQAAEGRQYFPKYQDRPLHPLQFLELGASWFLKARMLRNTPKAFFAESPSGVDFHLMPIAGASFDPVFDGCSHEDNVKMLQMFLRRPREVIEPIPGRVMTLLKNDDGSLRDIPLDY